MMVFLLKKVVCNYLYSNFLLGVNFQKQIDLFWKNHFGSF
jgi:hypothetical protein